MARQKYVGISTFLLSAIVSLVVGVTAASAQNVPATAREAAKLPQYASRLAHAAATAQQGSPASSTAQHRAAMGGRADRSGLMSAFEQSYSPPDLLYSNGPINGTTDAWTINFGFATTDSFSGVGQVTGLSFGAWLFPGDVLQSVEVLIGSTPFSGDISDQVVSITQGACSGNQYGFNVCVESGTFNPGSQSGGGWVTLQNAIVNTGDPAYWDENSGPSMAEESSVGTIPSEAFTINGQCVGADEKPAPAVAVMAPPSPTQTYRVIYDFTGGADGGRPSTGLAMDAAGNLYGTTSLGGASSGTVFKLTPGAFGWRFSRLYAFSGANGQFPSTTPVVAPNGRVYGATAGGGSGHGVLFGLAPPGGILPTPFSNWMETFLYDFTGGSDGDSPGGDIILDNSGNIFGNAFAGGVNHQGTLYEYSSGSLQVLHAFPAFLRDGANPLAVVAGVDGLYGITNIGGDNGQGTLYTTAGGYQVLHSFGPYPYGGRPTSLATDLTGNLYGSEAFSTCEGLAGSHILQFSPPDWNGVALATLVVPGGTQVSTDALGNLYGTTDVGGQSQQGTVFKLTCCWTYTELHDFVGGPSDGASPASSPLVDAQGNIYGTTESGGAYGAGVVWEISP